MNAYFKNDNCQIYNVDCIEYMKETDLKFNAILTSPPYNTGRACTSELSRQHHWGRYDEYTDEKTSEEYIDWTLYIFYLFDKILKKDGVIMYNISYGSDVVSDLQKNTNSLVWLVVAKIIENTPFTVADKITWKKKQALPNNVSPNKLTRITEDIFIFVRKKELLTFNCNKKISSYSRSNQAFYENIYNFIEAKNNDGSCELNKATYSSELCEKLLKIYCKSNDVVFDPFNGTGTTGVACRNLNIKYVGTEISEKQCKYSVDRINNISVKKLLNGEEIIQKDLFSEI